MDTAESNVNVLVDGWDVSLAGNKDFFFNMPQHKGYTVHVIWKDLVGAPAFAGSTKVQLSGHMEDFQVLNWNDHPTFTKAIAGANGSALFISNSVGAKYLNIPFVKGTITAGLLTVKIQIHD